jgi:hypothetical protein
MQDAEKKLTNNHKTSVDLTKAVDAAAALLVFS